MSWRRLGQASFCSVFRQPQLLATTPLRSRGRSGGVVRSPRPIFYVLFQTPTTPTTPLIRITPSPFVHLALLSCCGAVEVALIFGPVFWQSFPLSASGVVPKLGRGAPAVAVFHTFTTPTTPLIRIK